MLDWLLESLFSRHAHLSAHDDLEPVWIDPNEAGGLGWVGQGGDLSVERLLLAYSQGIFPMYEEGEPICWWSPDPRAIIEFADLHVSRRLQRTIDSGKFKLTLNKDFAGVMQGCADRKEGTWVNSEMLAAYQRLHAAGFAHSAEAWHDGKLAGGVYGVALGGVFAGESMFHNVRDASKVALVFLVQRVQQCGFEMFDAQILNAHTASMGASEIPRAEYLERLHRLILKDVRLL
jgi:leucyl/phenylalanyl-tRNA--protein transferase